MTKPLLFSLLFAILAPCAAQAQRSLGYAFAGFGNETGYSAYFHPGIGGDWVSSRGFGLGGEVGTVLGRRRGAPKLVLLSGNGSYHVALENTIFDPFATAGVTVATAGGGADLLWNWGGGVNWWLRPRFGPRFEFRNHMWPAASRHLVEFRVGIAFR